MKNTAAIYCRLSEEDKNKKNRLDDSGSIQNQKLMLTEYAEKHGWEIYGIYSDDDYTGSDRNRPAFKRMISDARAKKFNIVLCKTLSRFTRELEVVETYIHNLFPLLGIRFVSIVDNIDTDIAGNKKSRQINGLINEWYLEDMSESIKAALKTRMKAGYFIGSFAPYGYKKDPDIKGHLVIDVETAQTVRDIFDMYINGVGRSGIAKILNEKGIPSPSEYYRIKGIRKTVLSEHCGRYWNYNTVSHILENEVYIGNLVQGRTFNPTYKSRHSISAEKDNWIRCENTHEPIIDKETWELARKIWNSRSKPCYKGSMNKFAGVLYCAKCGYGMGVAYNRHKRYYRCNGAKYGRVCCEGTNIFESTLEKSILDEIHKIKEKYLCKDIINRAAVTDIVKSRAEDLEKRKRKLMRNSEELSDALKNLYIDKLNGVISISQFIELSKGFEKERDELNRKISDVDSDMENESKQTCDEESRRKDAEKIISFDDISRELVSTFIDRINVGGNRENRTIDILWKF